MLNTNLLDYVLEHLRARRVKWVEVSRETGVPYDTLKKIAHGRTPNPGVQHVQRLADFFRAREPGEGDGASNVIASQLISAAASEEIGHG